MRTDDELDFNYPGAAELMPLETPILRVSRPVAACQRCRTAKIRCDGRLPACTACERSGRAKQCSSANTQFAPGKERSYVATLETKLEKLEKKIAEAKKRRQSSVIMLDSALSPQVPRRISVDATGKPKDKKARFRKELHDIDELVADFGFLTVNATARDYHYGFTFAMSYAKLILSASTREPLPTGMNKALPPRTTASAAIRLYVENFLTLIPVIEEANLYASLEELYQEGQKTATAMDHWTIRLVLAIASAAQSQQRGDTNYSDAIGHICAALELADQVLHPGSIWSIQAMLLLVQYSMLDPAHFDTWQLIGAASRAMIDLGMHQDPSKSSNTPRPKLELRRRVYYCVYVLDRITSVVQTRALSFSDDSANVAMPFSGKSSSPAAPSPGGSIWLRSSELALAYIQLRRLQSSWYTKIFQSGHEPLQDSGETMWTAYREMTDWFNKLPATTPTQLKEYFELELLYSYVYILSPSPIYPQPTEQAQKLIVEHASTYANKIQNIISRSVDPKTPSLFSFFDAIRVYTTARHFIDALSSNIESLVPHSRTSSLFSVSAQSVDTDIDPLAPNPNSSHSLLPTPPPVSEGLSEGLLCGIETINEFIAILSSFGHRFGNLSGVSGRSLRDRFQNESQPLLNQLHSKLQQQQQQQNSAVFWAQQPVTPQHQSSLAPSPRRSAGFYPSPPSTQYSPGFVPQELASAPLNPSWNMQQTTGSYHQQYPSSMDFGAPMTAPTAGNEFGISALAAWETLPGGSLNARFNLA